MKRMLLFFAAAVACGVHTNLHAQAPLHMSLGDCLEYAMSDNLTRQSMELSLKSAELDARQARLERLPNLSASANGNLGHQNGERRTTSASYGASTGVTIWQGGSINQNIKQSDQQREQARARVAQWDNTLAINIMTSYYAVKGYQELQRYQRALIEAGDEQVREGAERMKVGAIIESDYLMLEAQLAQNSNQIRQTQINIDNELRNLKALMSMPMSAEIELADPTQEDVVLPAEDDFIVQAEKASPDLELLRHGVSIAKTGVKISQAGFYPTLSASGGVSTGHNGIYNIGDQMRERLSQSVGVSLSVPIFSRGRTRLSVDKAKISLQQAELESRQGELDVRQTLLRSYSNALSARDGFETSVVRENAYRRSLEASRAQYRTETIKAVELLQQENNYINVMYEFVQNKYSLLLQKGILDVYMGR